MRKLVVLLVTLFLVTCVEESRAQESILIGINMELTGYSSDPGSEQYRGVMAAHHLQPTVSTDTISYVIEFAVCDNQTHGEESANCATRLINQGAVGVIGGYSTSMSLAAAPILQDAGVVQISTGSTNPVTTQLGDFIFRIPFTDNYQGQALASYAYDTLGARRAVVFQQNDDDYSVGLARVFVQVFQNLGGQVQLQSFDQATADFSAQLDNAQRFHPDVLVTTAFCPLAGPLVRQSRTAGFDQQWLGGDSLDSPSCVMLGGEAFEGVFFTSFPDLTQLAPDALERAAAVRESYRDLYPNSPGFGGITLAGSDAYEVLREAIKQALTSGATPTDIAEFRVAVRAALASLVDYPGVTGNLTFAGTDGTPASRSIGLLTVEDVDSDGNYVRVAKGYFMIEPAGVVYYQGE